MKRKYRNTLQKTEETQERRRNYEATWCQKWGLNSNEESYAHNDNGVGSFESSMFMSSKRGCKESRSTLPTKSQTDRGLFGSLEIV